MDGVLVPVASVSRSGQQVGEWRATELFNLTARSSSGSPGSGCLFSLRFDSHVGE